MAEKLMTTRVERPFPSWHASDDAIRRLGRLSPEELDAEAARIAERLAKNEAERTAGHASKGSSAKGRVVKPGRGRSQAKAKKVAKRKP